MSHGNTIQYTKEEILKAIEGSGSIMSTIAKRLNCSWTTAETKVNLYDETKEAFQAERQKIIDMAEGVVFESVQAKDVQSAKWILSTIGKKRGYSEKLEVDANVNFNEQVNKFKELSQKKIDKLNKE